MEARKSELNNREIRIMTRHTDVGEVDNRVLLVEPLTLPISSLKLKMIQCHRRKDLSRIMQGDGLHLRKELVLNLTMP